MMLGDIFMRRQEPLKAMPEYRQAVDLNPDYLDKNTTLFQGKKLKVAVSEALTGIEKAIRLNQADASINISRKNAYYLQRKIAGSCS
jgi:tetratricopeptide (TPR) repeat protein